MPLAPAFALDAASSYEEGLEPVEMTYAERTTLADTAPASI